MSYFIPMGEWELFNFYWAHTVLLQAGLIKMHYTWNGTCTTERGEKMKVLIWQIPPLAHLLMPDSAASPGHHVRYVQQVNFLKLPTFLSPQGTVGTLFSHWYDLLAAVFVPSIRLGDIIA